MGKGMATSVIKSSKARITTISVIALVAVLVSLLVVSSLITKTSAAPPPPGNETREKENNTFHVAINGSGIISIMSVVIDVSGICDDRFSGQIDEGTLSVCIDVLVVQDVLVIEGVLVIGEPMVAEIFEGWARIEMQRFDSPTFIMECSGVSAEYMCKMWVRLTADVKGEDLTNVYGFVGIGNTSFVETFVGEGTVKGFEVPKPQYGTLVLEAEGLYTWKGKTYQVKVHVEADWELDPMERDNKKQLMVDVTKAEVTIKASDGIGDGTYSIWGKKFESKDGLKFKVKVWDNKGAKLSLSGTLYDESGAERGSISGFKVYLPDVDSSILEGGSVNIYAEANIKLDKNANAGIPNAISIKPSLQGTLEIENTSPEEE